MSLDLAEEEMKRRVLTRGEQGSGRADDNAEALVQRFRDFRAASMPVIELLEGKGMLSRISSAAAPDEVYRQLAALLREAGMAQPASTLARTVRSLTPCLSFVCLHAVSCVRSLCSCPHRASGQAAAGDGSRDETQKAIQRFPYATH